MFLPFLYELRRRKVPVGTHEAVALARALCHGLHGSGLDGFYHVARALLVHSEAHLDSFDQAFLQCFAGAAVDGLALRAELLEWLEQARASPEGLAQVFREGLSELDLDALRRELRRLLAEQRERHDGGARWIGTGGSSRFGRAGVARAGVRIGRAGGGGRGALAVAGERRYRDYRADLALDVRQMSLALRKLRAFAREGADDELDLDATIDATARNAGELEVVMRPTRRPSVRVLLLLDVGGSMSPYEQLVSRLFSAASKATHFKELQTYYFHNCVYGRVFRSARLGESLSVPDLLARTSRATKLVVVGDALMAPYELHADPIWGDASVPDGLSWLRTLTAHFRRSAWLTPEPPAEWPGTTIATIAAVLPMFPLTLQGLDDAVRELTAARPRARFGVR